MKAIKSALLGLTLLGVAATAHAQNEQFIPMNGYWVGPYAAGPYAEGSYEATIPVDAKILALVKPEFRAFFAAKR